jgi:glycosyltransferase involved in cell wall biosynthesis
MSARGRSLVTIPLRLLTVGHSYVVGLNRRLPQEMARAGRGRWEITVVAPRAFAGRNDLGPLCFEPEARDQACATVTVPVHLSAHPHLFSYGRTLRDLMARPWDMIHCWQEPYVMAGVQVARLTPRQTPFVFWTAQTISRTYPPPFSQMEQYCLRRCLGWMACGRTTVETLLPRGYGARPYRILPLGVDVDHFRPNPDARSDTLRDLGWGDPGPPVVGFLGRFSPEKGPLFLTRVLDRVKTPWRALFVGRGPQEAPLRAWAEKHEDRVRLVTSAGHSAVPRYLNAMDMLCAPSRTLSNRREQQGRMITEAWACGLPVIGSDCGEIPHVVGDAGIILGETDEGEWARSVSALLESPRDRADLGERGLDRSRSEFAWPVIAARYLDYFEELLAGPRADPG